MIPKKESKLEGNIEVTYLTPLTSLDFGSFFITVKSLLSGQMVCKSHRSSLVTAFTNTYPIGINNLGTPFFSIYLMQLFLFLVVEKDRDKHGSEEDLAPKISKISDNAKSVLADLQSGRLKDP